jgi:hypothetical protein
MDEPDSKGSNILLKNTRKEYRVAANWFIAGHGNKINLDYSHFTLNDVSSNRGFEDDHVCLHGIFHFKSIYDLRSLSSG